VRGTASAWPAAQAPARGRAGTSRTPFILLMLSLLGGGLVCLLVINTTLGAASFEIDKLQQSATARSLQAQVLEQQLAASESPGSIEQEACALGMRPQQRLEFLDLRTHRVYRQPVGKLVAPTPTWCKR